MTSLFSPRAFRASVFRAAVGLTLLPGLLAGSFPLAWADTPVPKVITYTLPTGQTLYVKEDHSHPIITIDTWVKTGSVNESDQNNGVSHFLEHLLFKGTDKYKAGEIDRMLEARGSQFNAATSDDFTHFYITTATPYFDEAMRMHADMMINAAIPPTELTQERKVVQEEINRATDNPDRQMFIEMSKMLYGTHGYGLDTLGPKENIAKIPRENILAYYHYWYQPKNFNTVVVGDVDPAQVKALAEQIFPAPPFARPEGYQPPTVSAVAPLTKPQAKVLDSPNVSQAYEAIAMLGPSEQKPEDVYALDMAMLALGGGKSSRLYRALREQKPLVTDVSASNYTQKYSGTVMVYAETTPQERETVKKELLSQLVALKERGITQEELDKAKTQYLKDFIFENETTDGTASSIGYNVTIGSLQDYLDHVSNVQKVTREQVQTALNHYIDLDRAVFVEMLPSSLKADLPAETAKNLALLQSNAGTAQATTSTQTATTSPAEAAVPVTKTVLPNGMTLLSKPLKDSSTVAIKIFVKGGQGVETIPGVSSLTSATMMQGTQGRTAEQISRELESKGLSLSVSTDEDFIEVTGASVSEDFGELFTILADVLTHPTFAQSELDKKKQQMHQAIAANRDNPSSVAFENLSMALYPTHPYGNEGERIDPNLGKITRQNVLDYYRRYFQPQNMVVSVVGNFEPDTVADYLESLYPACPNHTCPADTTKIPPVPALTKSRTVTEEKPKLAAVWMAQGWLVPPIENADYAALKVLNSLVGTGMSSRLFVDLREKQGLAYVVGSFYPSRAQESRFVMHIGTDPVNTDKVQQGFTEEIKRLQTETVPAQELAEAKSKLIGSFALAHDTNINQAYYMGLYEAIGAGYRFDNTYPDLINKVTAADIQRVAQKYFSGPSVISIIKPANMPKNATKPAASSATTP